MLGFFEEVEKDALSSDRFDGHMQNAIRPIEWVATAAVISKCIHTFAVNSRVPSTTLANDSFRYSTGAGSVMLARPVFARVVFYTEYRN